MTPIGRIAFTKRTSMCVPQKVLKERPHLKGKSFSSITSLSFLYALSNKESESDEDIESESDEDVKYK